MVGALHRLNIGCGEEILDGWTNLDVVDRGQEVVFDVLAGRLPWRERSWDLVYANHFLQSFDYVDVEHVMGEIARVANRVLILVPDVAAAMFAFEHGDAKWPGFELITEDWSLDRKAAHYLTWGGQNRSCFTPGSLRELISRHGMTPRAWTRMDVQRTALPDSDPRPSLSRWCESITVEAVHE